MKRYTRGLIGSLLVLLLVGAMTPAGAQEEPEQVFLVTPYLGVSVEPGDRATFNITVEAPEGEEVRLTIAETPEGWTATVRGGGFIVDRVLVAEGVDHRLDLEVEVPPDAAAGTYRVSLLAEGASGSDRLDFDITVAEAVGSGVFLTAEFPVLRGPSDARFNFTLDLENRTSDEIQFGLQAEGPEGWQINARPSGASQASTISLAAGESGRITVEVDPPDFVAAGSYPVVLQAVGGGQNVSSELIVDVTGSFAMILSPPDERLNFTVQAGQPTEVPLVVVNEGTAPLRGVTFSATPPRGWEVTFIPEAIEQIEPGAVAELRATVTPAADAITGDYRLVLRSRVAETTDQVELRATVETSAAQGLIGVLVVILALAALALVFRQFGRR